MDILDFIERKEHQEIKEELKKAKDQKSLCYFNAFSMSSYNTHYENFHSDLIASILKPKAGHDEGNLFIENLIDFLNNSYNLKLRKKDYIDSIVERENGRIDVGIWNNESKKVIIIENKINNAVDMDEQLLRYYEYSIAKHFVVDAIVYLSLDGSKVAPLFPGITAPVVNLAAYTNSEDDLANGWIKKCIDTATNSNSISFLNEYYKLLQFLNSKAMENNAMDRFYQLINEDRSLSTINQIINLKKDIPKHRINKLVSRILDYKPFSTSYRYKENYHFFEGYNDGKNSFKLDFHFSDEGVATLLFWIPKIADKDVANNIIKEKLIQIEAVEIFNIEELSFKKEYQLGSNTFQNMNEIVSAIYNDIVSLLNKLKDDK